MELKPLKAPSQSMALSDLTYPILTSYKIDGVRAIVKNGKILSSTMKELPNEQLAHLFAPLLKKKDFVFDGEIYSRDLHFTELIGYVMAKDRVLDKSISFYIFDMLPIDDWNNPALTYEERLKLMDKVSKIDNIHVIEQHPCNDINRIKALYELAKELNYEGLMFRNPKALYKHGRATLKENIIYKYKRWDEYDAQIVSVHEMVGNIDGIEREVDETGHKKQVHSKFLKEPQNTFGYFTVNVEMYLLDKVSITTMKIGGWKGLTDELRKHIWENQKDYIGKWVRFKGMSVGSLNAPRIPKELEFRDDK